MNPRLQYRLNQLRMKTAIALNPSLAQRASMPAEEIHIAGHIRVRELPFKDEAEWRHWWLGEFDASGRMIRPPRMSEKEKDRYTVAESANLITNNGIAQILNFVGSQDGSTVPFAQYFAFGNGPLNMVSPSDTTLNNEIFRIIPTIATINGTQTDISTFHAGGASPVSITNCGLYGNGATATLNSGTLLTHSMMSYTQPAASSVPNVTYDYLLSYQ